MTKMRVWRKHTMMWALAVLQLTSTATTVAGSLTRMPLVSNACPRVAVTRSNNIVMRQQGAESVVLALTRAKSPRSGRAELVELQRAVDAASGARLDPALIREARSLLAGVKDGGKPSAASVAKEAAARQLATSLARAKSARSGRAELAELSRALDAATAARVDGGAIREAREMIAAKGRAATEKAAAEKAAAEKATAARAAAAAARAAAQKAAADKAAKDKAAAQKVVAERVAAQKKVAEKAAAHGQRVGGGVRVGIRVGVRVRVKV